MNYIHKNKLLNSSCDGEGSGGGRDVVVEEASGIKMSSRNLTLSHTINLPLRPVTLFIRFSTTPSRQCEIDALCGIVLNV